jgi:glycosyltransferase involved in cell wall biosynthesis
MNHETQRTTHVSINDPKEMPSVMVAQLGARNHYAAPIALQRYDMLQTMCTDYYDTDNGKISTLLKMWSNVPWLWKPTGLKRGSGRQDSTLDETRVRSHPLGGLVFAGLLPFSERFGLNHLVFIAGGKWLSHRAARLLNADTKIVYAVNSSALELFQSARKRGIKCVLEQVSMPKRQEIKLLQSEYAQWSDWEEYRHARFVDMFAEREQREYALADLILAPSEAVRAGLIAEGVPDERIEVVPYGINANHFPPKTQFNQSNKCLRVLYAGGVNVHKGIQHLYEAVKDIGREDIEVRVAGSVFLKPDAAALVGERCELLGKVPRATMPELYRWADVFVLPSASEGSALVTYEAMSAGLPVITTLNAGSIVRDGLDGYIVPVADSVTIADRLQTLRLDPGLRRTLAQNALHRFTNYGSLEAYENRLISAVGTLI